MFARLVSESSYFPFSASTQFNIPVLDDFSATGSRAVQSLCETALGLLIVEMIPDQGITLFGKSLQGSYIVGLAKTKPRAVTARGGRGASSSSTTTSLPAPVTACTVLLEFKCGNRWLADAMIEEVNEWVNEQGF